MVIKYQIVCKVKYKKCNGFSSSFMGLFSYLYFDDVINVHDKTHLSDILFKIEMHILFHK